MVGRFFLLPCPVRQWFSLTFWARVWWTYALYDPSYADRTTFGFWIDVSNGHVTLLPTLLCLVGMTYDLVDARTFGIINLLAFYQEFVGTVIYFCTYFFNGRHAGRKRPRGWSFRGPDERVVVRGAARRHLGGAAVRLFRKLRGFPVGSGV